jgi:hypothetical protein
MSTLRALREDAIADGTYTPPGREEWAESRRREGWSRQLVEEAKSAGRLAHVRDAIRTDDCVRTPGVDLIGEAKRWAEAVEALAMIDSGRACETRYPRYGPDTLPLQRRTYAPPRLRAD